MRTKPHYQNLETDRVCSLVNQWALEQFGQLDVLDYGCGPGRYLSLLSSLRCSLTGVDSNLEYVRSGISKGYRCYSDSQFFEATNERYDAIILSHLVEHVSPEELVLLLPKLVGRLKNNGRLIIVTPMPGDRFYHDFSHVRPYLPQSIRHGFGQQGAPLSYGERNLIELKDIYFFKDPYKTRNWRSFYFANGVRGRLTLLLNKGFDILWWISKGRIGVTASWLGIYQLGEPPAGLL